MLCSMNSLSDNTYVASMTKFLCSLHFAMNRKPARHHASWKLSFEQRAKCLSGFWCLNLSFVDGGGAFFTLRREGLRLEKLPVWYGRLAAGSSKARWSRGAEDVESRCRRMTALRPRVIYDLTMRSSFLRDVRIPLLVACAIVFSTFLRWLF